MKNNKGFVGIGLILAIIAVLVIGGGTYYMSKSSNAVPKNIETNNIPRINQENVPSVPAIVQNTLSSLKEFKNNLLGISFSYPKEYGDVIIKFNTNDSDKTKQFIGTFSNNSLTFGSPSVCELCDANTKQYAFQYGVGIDASSLEGKNINKVSFHYVQDQNAIDKFHAIFILKNNAYKTVEFYGKISEDNQKIIDSVSLVPSSKNTVVNNQPANKSSSTTTTTTVTTNQPAGFVPTFYIGKLKADYSIFLWVTLSTDKTEMVGGSAPNNDFQKKYIALHGGYVEGGFIGPLNVPIDLTVADYKLTSVYPPTLSFLQMYNMIIEKDPFTELYKCNNTSSFSNDYSSSAVTVINNYIDNNQLSVKCVQVI